MKLKFFQPALLVVAATAAEANEESQTASYFPDMLVQTASIIDFFYPQEQEQVSVAEVLAQTAAEADVDAEAENDGLTRVNMRDNQNNMLTVEIPKDEHKIIQYKDNTLTIEDESDSASSDSDILMPILSRPTGVRSPSAPPRVNVIKPPTSPPVATVRVNGGPARPLSAKPVVTGPLSPQSVKTGPSADQMKNALQTLINTKKRQQANRPLTQPMPSITQPSLKRPFMAGPKDTLPVGKVVPMPIRPAVIKPKPIIVGGPGSLPPRLPTITPKARPTGLARPIGLTGPASAKIAAARTAREEKDLNMNSLKDKIDQISSSSETESSDSESNSKASSSSTSDSESSDSSSSSNSAQSASSSDDSTSDSKSESESESDEESSSSDEEKTTALAKEPTAVQQAPAPVVVKSAPKVAVAEDSSDSSDDSSDSDSKDSSDSSDSDSKDASESSDSSDSDSKDSSDSSDSDGTPATKAQVDGEAQSSEDKEAVLGQADSDVIAANQAEVASQLETVSDVLSDAVQCPTLSEQIGMQQGVGNNQPVILSGGNRPSGLPCSQQRDFAAEAKKQATIEQTNQGTTEPIVIKTTPEVMPVGAPGTVVATTAPTPADPAPAPAPAALAQIDFESAENYDGLW